MLTYSERAKRCRNPTAVKLLRLMDEKKTNLCVSLDVTREKELLQLADALGPVSCILKTHIDILEDFTAKTTDELRKLATCHNFLIFEDRKFADIGHTVQLQYQHGVYRIADWAALTNAHTVPGPGIIEGLKHVGLPKGNGLLLLAEMSSKDNLAQGEYTQKTLAMARQHADFVIGFITQHKLLDDERFINLTPGVNLTAEGDALGQNYITPSQAILTQGSDVIIVGRGIYQAADPYRAAEQYRELGWEAYQQRLKLK